MKSDTGSSAGEWEDIPTDAQNEYTREIRKR